MCFFLNYTIAGMDVAWMPVATVMDLRVKELVIDALKDLLEHLCPLINIYVHTTPLMPIEFTFWVVGKAVSKPLTLTFTDAYLDAHLAVHPSSLHGYLPLSALQRFLRDVFSALLSAFEDGHWVQMYVTHRYMQSEGMRRRGIWSRGEEEDMARLPQEKEEDKLEWDKFVHLFQQGFHEPNRWASGKNWYGVLYTGPTDCNRVVAKTTCKPRINNNGSQMDNSLQILLFLWNNETHEIHSEYQTRVLGERGGVGWL